MLFSHSLPLLLGTWACGKECPSKRAYIATEDGGYISTSDVEEDIEDEPASNEDQMGVSVSSEDVDNQWIFIVQRVLST